MAEPQNLAQPDKNWQQKTDTTEAKKTVLGRGGREKKGGEGVL